MKKEKKRYVDIGGKYWDVGFPFCSGCPELCIGGICAFDGNGCRYPDKRIRRPRTYKTAFAVLQKKSKLTDEQIRKLEIKTFESK